MTYAKLLEILSQASPEQLAQDVTVEVDNEYYGVVITAEQCQDGVLDQGHLYFTCG